SAVPACDVTDSVVHMIEPQAAAKGLQFSTNRCPPNVTIWVDRSKLEQVLLNLLSNAVKFTSKGAVTLRCEWDDPKVVRFTVRDTGVGIAEDQLERIFEPFVQV